MEYNSEKQWLLQQLNATRELLSVSTDSVLMQLSLKNRIAELEAKLDSIEDCSVPNTSISLWFSGNATMGSLGVKGAFMKDTIASVEGMIKSATTRRLRSSQGKRGTKKPQGAFYVTALTNGSFGYELSYMEEGTLFGDPLVSESIGDVICLIEETSAMNANIEEMIDKYPIRLLSHLKDFYSTIKKNSSFLKVESGSLGIELDNIHTEIGYENLCSSNISEQNDVICGIFQGAFVESGKFEYTDENGKLRHGSISDDIDVEAITEIIKRFTHQKCKMSVIRHISSLANGKKSEQIELLSIEEITEDEL